VEPIKLDETLIEDLKPVRFENGKPLLIAGLGERYTWESSKAIPAQWQRLVPYLGTIPRQVGRTTFGVSCNGDDEGNFDYIAGTEVTDFSGLPTAFSRLRLGEQKYAIFAHREHISAIRRTVCTIWTKWLPDSGHEAADAPGFERFGEAFDFPTGTGSFEIWIPIKA
jgi:AraC family transcriptional regulator